MDRAMEHGPVPNPAEPNERVTALINEYFDRQHAGEDLTPSRFAREHPAEADELEPYLEGLSLLDHVRTEAGETHAELQFSADPHGLPFIEGYELLEELGRGGMGVAYRANQLGTKRVVALKVMLAGPFASPAARRRFDREVHLAARLQHPAIVRVLESGEAAGMKYFAMDFVEGVKLSEYLASSPPDRDMILALFRKLCEAVQYAHEQGVIHRDLKPANILIDHDGAPHILDFGLAKAIDQAGEPHDDVTTSVSIPGQVMGTLPYLSPEQAAGHVDQVDERTDVYAIGVMLYEALTGAMPYEITGTPSAVIERITESPPRAPSSLSRHVNREIETVLLKALQKGQQERYQTAGAFGGDLERYLRGDPVLAKRPSGLYVARKRMRKHRFGVLMAAALLIAVAAYLVHGERTKRDDVRRARAQAMSIQRSLESDEVERVIGKAQAFYQSHPLMPEACLIYAHAQFRMPNLFNDALRTLDTCSRRAPESWLYKAMTADIYESVGEYERAENAQRLADATARDDADAWYLRSFATLELEEALSSAEEAVRREPENLLYVERVAHLQLATGDLEGALAASERMIERSQDDGSWLVFQASIQTRLGRIENAIADYSRLIDLPEGAAHSYSKRTAYLYRAHAYRRIGEYERAVEDYTRVAAIDEGDVGLLWDFYQRATPLWILGRHEEAATDYREFHAVYGQPFYSDARLYLILREQGKLAEADEVLTVALNTVQDPWLAKIFACLAGRTAPDELVEAAGTNREHRCEGFYYAGEVHLLAGEVAAARLAFEQCVKTGIEYDLNTFPLTPMNEHELAQWRLRSLSTPDPL